MSGRTDESGQPKVDELILQIPVMVRSEESIMSEYLGLLQPDTRVRVVERGIVSERRAHVDADGGLNGWITLVSSEGRSFAESFDGGRIVIGLDINGTIIEGDTTHNIPLNGLTEPAMSFFRELNKHKNAQVVYFTFGQDWEKAILWASEFRKVPVKHRFFVARRTENHDEIWAFKLDPPSKYIDWTGKNPVILPRVETEDCPTDFDQNPAADLFRLTGPGAYQRFIDRLLKDGDVVLRAAFDPVNSHFLGRKNADKIHCKVLAAGAPCLVLDDNPQDWTVLTDDHEIIHAHTPGNAPKKEAEATDFVRVVDGFLHKFMQKRKNGQTSTDDRGDPDQPAGA